MSRLKKEINKIEWVCFKAQSEPSWLSSLGLICKSNSCFPCWEGEVRWSEQSSRNRRNDIERNNKPPTKKYHGVWMGLDARSPDFKIDMNLLTVTQMAEHVILKVCHETCTTLLHIPNLCSKTSNNDSHWKTTVFSFMTWDTSCEQMKLYQVYVSTKQTVAVNCHVQSKWEWRTLKTHHTVACTLN